MGQVPRKAADGDGEGLAAEPAAAPAAASLKPEKAALFASFFPFLPLEVPGVSHAAKHLARACGSCQAIGVQGVVTGQCLRLNACWSGLDQHA